MSLTPDQDAYFRKRLGSGYDDFDAETRLTRLGGVGFEPAVVVEVLEQRLSDMSQKPASFTIPGEYSEDRRANIEMLQGQLVDARNEAGAAGLDVAKGMVVITQPYNADYDQRALDTEEFMVRGRLRGGR